MNTRLLFLYKDYAALERNINSLKESLKTAVFESGEISHQSSETWHDNYGFEEADRERKRLMGTLEELQNIYAHAEATELLQPARQVTLGATVTIQNMDTGEEQTFLIGSYMVLEKIAPNEFSYAAPLISQLMGASVGDMREVEIGGITSRMRIISIL